MATVKECVGKSVGCKNLIRKMHSGLQMLNAIRAVFVGTSQSRLKQVENATDDIKALRLKRGQTVADLLQELSNLINVRDDCSDTPMESELKGFFLMEIIRNSESEGGAREKILHRPPNIGYKPDPTQEIRVNCKHLRSSR